MQRIAMILMLLMTARLSAEDPAQRQARIKDIATVEGVRDNQLVGYGIVVGLHGTGDSQQTGFSTQTLASMLLRMGVSVPATGIRVQNLAAVFVSATLPPFARPGAKIDITASSAGDANSLEGGVLMMTPLYGADGKIYAQAQGPLVVGGYSVSVNGNTKQFNHPTTARVPLGAMVERGIPMPLAGVETVSLLLNDLDFKSAEAVASENERTGTVVIGGSVVLQPVSILHGGLAVNIVNEFQVSQPGPFASGNTQTVQQTRVDAKDKPVNRIELKQGATVDDLVRSLQTIGASARDVISILQTMKTAGALEAELEVQ